NLLKGVLALANVVVELGRCQVMDALVVPAVAGDLMSVSADGMDQFGLLAGELAEDEKGGALTVTLEFVENPVRHRGDAASVVTLAGVVKGEPTGCLDAPVL